ncbi:twin-arginine translocase TatA/TatE family subunit [Sphingomonas ginkgonis]|uniref:Sec-independent protein translocase protein TatA n=1 Tax=Sphingomonas ginkgonis TaxID=2315330 RepID=A0A3R9YNY0_9SPHN|nr:twin-arginine translocase TatA/TatE family subunit [Sphingomonas ginkgonis]RST31806.1 twin-arginine translocase TatA/TatE family subunit [Sphingomonas ginkgonis]
MGSFSLWHILILAILVLLLFGGNRFSNMMGDLAKGMKQFKAGMADDEEEKRRDYERQRWEQQQRLGQTPDRPIEVSSTRAPDPVAPPPPPAQPVAPPPEDTRRG